MKIETKYDKDGYCTACSQYNDCPNPEYRSDSGYCDDYVGMATKKRSVVLAYYALEDWLYVAGKERSIDIKAAMVWGGLAVLRNHGDIDWKQSIEMYGEFMSKAINLR